MQMVELSQYKFLKYLGVGYVVWFVQNGLLLTALSVYYYRSFYARDLLPPDVQSILRSISNSIMFAALLLDLLAIFLFVYGGYFLRHNSSSPSAHVLLFSGLLWIVVSLFWRFPFFLQGPLDFGFFTPHHSLYLPEFQFYPILSEYDFAYIYMYPFMFCSLFVSSLCSLVFFSLLYRRLSSNRFRGLLNRGTIYGFLNLSSITLFILILFPLIPIEYSFHIYLTVEGVYIWLFCFSLKMLIIPLYAMVLSVFSLRQLRKLLRSSPV